MMETVLGTLVLALGNEILGDDAVGLLAARRLADEWKGRVEIKEASTAGFGLLDYLSGYDRVLILDSIVGDSGSAGTVQLMTPSDFSPGSVSSPHFVGLSELSEAARALEIPFPTEIKLLVMSVTDPFVLRESLTKEVADALPKFVESARRILTSWAASDDRSRMHGRPANALDC